MSETELSVICKNCGSEVSPYVTECPYCGARLRKRAPKLERRGDALEAMRPQRRKKRARFLRRRAAAAVEHPPYVTLIAILGSAVLLLIQKATGYSLLSFGGAIAPLDGEWWRLLSAPFAYLDVGYLFVVAVGLAIFATGLEHRLGSVATGVLLIACGSLGTLAAVGAAGDEVTVVAGGNGMALGAVAAWFAIRRAEAHESIAVEYDMVGVAVAAAVLLALPIFAPSANFIAGLAGGAVGGLAGLAASAMRSSR